MHVMEGANGNGNISNVRCRTMAGACTVSSPVSVACVVIGRVHLSISSRGGRLRTAGLATGSEHTLSLSSPMVSLRAAVSCASARTILIRHWAAKPGHRNLHHEFQFAFSPPIPEYLSS